MADKQAHSREYFKIRYRTAAGEHTDWVEKIGEGQYQKMTREGVPAEPLNIILLAAEDLVWEKPSTMNNMYGTLELSL